MERPTEDVDKSVLIEILEQALGHEFDDRSLLDLALTHRSFANESGDDGAGTNYERLEFLGDAILDLIAAEWLYRRDPEAPEGKLSRRKSYLVSAPVLAHYATTLGIGPLLRLGVGEDRSGGRSKTSILADVVEALFGAVYLDGGLEAARAVVHPLLEQAVSQRRKRGHADAKTRLQEHLQAGGRPVPEYRLVAEAGPDHHKRFTVECWAEDERLGAGEGRSKKVAEQRAAHAALVALDLLVERP